MTLSPPQIDPQTQPDAGADDDAASYALLFDRLTRAATTGPWWRRWWNAAVDVLQSSWQSGFATLSAANRGPQRRWFTIAAAGATALVLSTTGVITAVQENWTPTRISAALKLDEQEPPPEPPANPPAERPAIAPLENRPPADRKGGAGPDDEPAVPVAARKQVKTRDESASEESSSRRSAKDRDEAAGSGTPREREQEPEARAEPEAAEPAQASAEQAPAAQPAPAPQPARAAQPAPAPRDPTLNPGDVLRAGNRRESANGLYTLTMQSDGNLVAYRNGVGAIWSAGTHGNPGAYAVNQADGNVVVYNASGPLWSTRTAGRSGTVLVIQDDGNVVARAGGAVVWASGSAQ